MSSRLEFPPHKITVKVTPVHRDLHRALEHWWYMRHRARWN